MPRSSCDYCCNPEELSRSNPMARAALLGIMCAILTALNIILPLWEAHFSGPPPGDPPGPGDEN